MDSSKLAGELQKFAVLLNSAYKYADNELDEKFHNYLKDFATLLQQAQDCQRLSKTLPDKLLPNLRVLYATLQIMMEKHNYQLLEKKSRFITKPQKITAIFGDLLNTEKFQGNSLSVMRIRKYWSKIIPNQNLVDIQVISLIGTKLMLSVRSKEQIVVIKMSKVQIIKRINLLFAYPIVEDIGFCK